MAEGEAAMPLFYFYNHLSKYYLTYSENLGNHGYF